MTPSFFIFWLNCCKNIFLFVFFFFFFFFVFPWPTTTAPPPPQINWSRCSWLPAAATVASDADDGSSFTIFQRREETRDASRKFASVLGCYYYIRNNNILYRQHSVYNILTSQRILPRVWRLKIARDEFTARVISGISHIFQHPPSLRGTLYGGKYIYR